MKNEKRKTKNYKQIPTLSGYHIFSFFIFNFTFRAERGYAALTTMLFTVGISLIILGGLSFFALQEVTINRNAIKSIEAKSAAEAGVEEAIYRVVSGKQIGASETLGTGKATTTIIITSSGSEKTIRSEGKSGAYQKNLETMLVLETTGINFHYGIQVGAGGLSMGNNAVVNGNVLSNGSITGNNGATITGSAVAAGAGNRIEDITIGNATSGIGRASIFEDTTVHGSSCPNPYCIIETPPQADLPIPVSVIQEWKDAGSAGGTCVPPECDTSGNYKITGGAYATLGPKRITGNLELDNGATLAVAGTIFVEGNIILSNSCTVRLASSYGALSGIIVTNGAITVSNNCTFQGSGQAGSYIMLLSDKNTPASEVITVGNNSLGVIFYAAQGRIKFSNGAAAKEATAYGITLDNSATITYESGLANMNFSSGPSGGYDVKYWKEVE